MSERNTNADTGQLRALDDVELCALDDPVWDIEGVTHQGDLEVGYGPSDAGKSTLYAARACCVATGTPWLGFNVLRKGPVVVLVFEGKHAFKKKIRAWKAQHSIAPNTVIGIYVVEDHVNFLQEHEVLQLIPVIKGLGAIELIVDTLAQSTCADEENEQMQLAVNNAALIRRETGARVVFIHHTGKNRRRGARGGTALTAAADVVLSLDPDKDHHALNCVRQRDGDRFPSVFLKLTKTPDGSTVLFERLAEGPAMSLLSDRGRDNARLRELVLSALRAHPKITATAVVKAVQKNKAAVLNTLAELKEAGQADFERDGRRSQLWSCR